MPLKGILSLGNKNLTPTYKLSKESLLNPQGKLFGTAIPIDIC